MGNLGGVGFWWRGGGWSGVELSLFCLAEEGMEGGGREGGKQGGKREGRGGD